MARQAKGKAPRTRRVQLQVKDYQHPGENKVKLTALAALWGPFILVGAVFLWDCINKQFLIKDYGKAVLWQVPVLIFLYPLLAVWLVNFFSGRTRRNQLKKLGVRARISRANRPEIDQMVANQSKGLSMPRPDAYVMEDEAPWLYSVPGRAGTVIMSTRAIADFSEQELAVLLGHEMGHIKTKHVSLDLAMTYLRSANPFVKLVAFPVAIMSVILSGWRDMIDYTADRCSLLVTGRPGLVTSTIVKHAALVSGGGEEEEEARARREREEAGTFGIREDEDEAARIVTAISPEDLEAYVAGGSDLSSDSAQVERAFKIARFIDARPNLKERIQQLNAYRATEAARAAFAKVKEIVAG